MRHRDRFVVRIRLLHSLFLLFPHLRLFIPSTHSIPNSFRSLHKEMGMQSLNSHSFLHFSSEAAEKTKGENSLNSFLHLLFLAMVITNKGEPLILRGQRQRHILVVKRRLLIIVLLDMAYSISKFSLFALMSSIRIHGLDKEKDRIKFKLTFIWQNVIQLVSRQLKLLFFSHTKLSFGIFAGQNLVFTIEKVRVTPIIEKMVESCLRVDQMKVSHIQRRRKRPRKTVWELITNDLKINVLLMNMIDDRALW
ncbi:hypothetical protein Lal_00043909 [Lupinus albus]|nr:hypothetical protein Lal_00043909 [Lupinus albus]